MKIIKLLIIQLLMFITVWGQTNLFPANGNVGIGTTNPYDKLSVFGTISSSSNANEGGTIFLENTSKTAPGVARRWALYNMTGQYGNSLQFWSYNDQMTNYGSKFTLSDNGNIGIGTINPSSKLEVLGQVNSYNVGYVQINEYMSAKNFVNFTSNNYGSVLVSSNLYMDGSDNLKIAKSHQTIAGSAILLPGNAQPNQGGITFYTSPIGTVTAEQNYAGNASMTITPTGNVGIGATNPLAKLEVRNGNVLVKNLANVTNESMPMIAQSLAGGTYTTFGTSINTFTESDGYNSYALQFLTQETYATGLNEKMRISANGNVGIGVATPNEKLTVNGKIRAREIKVESSPVLWPDYVFLDSYQLPSLEELEKYIKVNKHLPEIPTAEDVSKNGIALGELNRLLLKKIEELTLILIQKDKTIQDGNERLKKVEEKLEIIISRLNIK